MRKITLYIGLNDKDTKKQEIKTLDCYKIVTNILTNYDEGVTISEAVGIYKHEDGTVVTENSLRAEIYTDNVVRIKQAVFDIKGALNQESILMEITESDTLFI